MTTGRINQVTIPYVRVAIVAKNPAAAAPSRPQRDGAAAAATRRSSALSRSSLAAMTSSERGAIDARTSFDFSPNNSERSASVARIVRLREPNTTTTTTTPTATRTSGHRRHRFRGGSIDCRSTSPSTYYDDDDDDHVACFSLALPEHSLRGRDVQDSRIGIPKTYVSERCRSGPTSSQRPRQAHLKRPILVGRISAGHQWMSPSGDEGISEQTTDRHSIDNRPKRKFQFLTITLLNPHSHTIGS